MDFSTVAQHAIFMFSSFLTQTAWEPESHLLVVANSTRKIREFEQHSIDLQARYPTEEDLLADERHTQSHDRL
eukprot:SAG11_NODE_18619_length_485_cov_2.443005_2_plen_73_part_00